jgi:hypothetical protein
MRDEAKAKDKFSIDRVKNKFICLYDAFVFEVCVLTITCLL